MKNTALSGKFAAIAAAAVCLAACASIPQQKEMRSMARVYEYPYDVVFSSVEELLRRDLKCLLKKDDRGGGDIETEWVHRVDTEGKKRWMLMASLRKVKGNSTEVVFFKKYELQDEVSKSLDKYNKKKKEDTPSGGWLKSEVDLSSLDDLYGRLEKKLGANP